MKKLGILIILLSVGLVALGSYSRRYSPPASTTDVNYADLAALIDVNELVLHDAATVADTDSVDLTLTGQQIKADVNETWLAAQSAADPNSHDAITLDPNMASLFTLNGQVMEVNLTTPADGVTKLSTADMIYDFIMGLIRTSIEPYGAADANMVTHLAAYDHNDIGTGTADINDTEYGSWMEDNSTEVPSAGSLYDKFESIVSGAIGFTSSDSITFTIIDGNLVPDINDAWLDVNAPAGGSGDANAVMAAHLSAFDHNDISAYRYYSFTITDPNSYYDSNSVFPVDCNIASALALLEVRVTCDKNPATELDLDLKYATDYSLAGATLISALDTTAGKSTTALTSSVAADKFFYIQFGARPDGDIDWVRLDIKCTTNDFDFKQVVVVEPNECYDVNAIFPIDYCFNAATISQIQFKCDINPTSEPNITLYYGDAQTGSGTKICDIDTTDGKVTVSSFDDATITAGSDIWGVWNKRPDADIKWEIIKIARTDD